MSFGETLSKLAIGAAIGGTAVYLWDRYVSDDFNSTIGHMDCLDDDDDTAAPQSTADDAQKQKDDVTDAKEQDNQNCVDTFFSKVDSILNDLDKDLDSGEEKIKSDVSDSSQYSTGNAEHGV